MFYCTGNVKFTTLEEPNPPFPCTEPINGNIQSYIFERKRGRESKSLPFLMPKTEVMEDRRVSRHRR
ncbi:hypothetical protein LguiB_013226 [Lonicera macranthoides]